MRTALAIVIGVLIALAMITSFSEPLGLDLLWPGLDGAKSAVVGTVFLVMAIAGLFYRIWKRKTR